MNNYLTENQKGKKQKKINIYTEKQKITTSTKKIMKKNLKNKELIQKH